MKMKWMVMTIAAIVASVAQAHATVLPDACGDDKVKFDVKTQRTNLRPRLRKQAKLSSS